MEIGNQVRLTSAEITSLWASYINDTAISCKFKYFLSIVEDEEIKPILKRAFDIAQGNLKTLTEIFNKEKYPIPYGFKLDEDVNISAPRLYSDSYVLHYLHQSSQIALQGYSMNLTLSVRGDVYSHFNECISQLTTFLREVKELLLSKGLYIRSPYLPIPDEIDFVKRKSFLKGFFGEKRPLIGTEVTNLFANFQRNAFGVATLLGFSQVAQSKEVAEYLVRGKDIAKKHCELFGSILTEGDLPTPMSWGTEVTDSTASTFSDKLMMFYTTTLIALSIGFYGTSMAMSPRKDLGLHYVRLSAEIAKYAEEGANIMIKNGWLEQPPMAADRDELSKK
ncbi:MULTISPECIES: DUF3231 family protein [Neobacillus]|uniref:DUF3231 family protein n=1 Tax=Neobacillus rhizophilus TaxID=2833579 RepID=A0A942U5Y9_9BACI|nr:MULTISPECIES: DUF3231 family protein [Neobacillus]MBS4213965.1 DUF3231 family protein [Neobacillus rhizophilus]MBU8917630.1 DUF3231 family protein [Bacillus sp. FJAT-29953]